MRSVALIIVLIAAHFTSGHAQLTFTTNTNKNPTANTMASSTAGVLITLTPDATNTYSWWVSDALSTSVITDFYVTLVCAQSLVDMGPVIGTAAPAAAILGSAAAAGTKGDIISASTVGPLTGTTTAAADAYIIAPGQTIRYTFDPTISGATYWAVNIRDVTANSIQNTPCNAAGTSSGTSTKCPLFTKASTLAMGFEVLNKGNAIFCIQTQAQWTNGNTCDASVSKSSTCNAAGTGSYTAASTKCTNKLYHNSCTDTCPAGSYAYTAVATAGCVDCGAALDTNGFCTKTIVLNTPVSTSSSSLLRVGQIAAMFVGSIYFVLFA